MKNLFYLRCLFGWKIKNKLDYNSFWQGCCFTCCKLTTMSKKTILFAFLFFGIWGFSQSLINDKFELYLIAYDENTLSIDKGMQMTSKVQTYYNGTIEVVSTDTGKTKNFDFFFSIWDNKFKEFLIKDKSYNDIAPKLSFENNKSVFVTDSLKTEVTLLKDSSKIENVMLSSMIVWLENQVIAEN